MILIEGKFAGTSFTSFCHAASIQSVCANNRPRCVYVCLLSIISSAAALSLSVVVFVCHSWHVRFYRFVTIDRRLPSTISQRRDIANAIGFKKKKKKIRQQKASSHERWNLSRRMKNTAYLSRRKMRVYVEHVYKKKRNINMLERCA